MGALLLLPPESIPLFGGQVEALIESALVHADGEDDLPGILDALSRREMFAWISLSGDGVNALAIVKVVEDADCRRSLLIYLAAGRRLARFLPRAVAFAKDERCERIEAFCRKSVSVLLKRAGFTDTGRHLMTLDLTR